jgi:hypothetical protein
MSFAGLRAAWRPIRPIELCRFGASAVRGAGLTSLSGATGPM